MTQSMVGRGRELHSGGFQLGTMPDGRRRHPEFFIQGHFQRAADSSDHGEMVNGVTDEKLQFPADGGWLPLDFFATAIHLHQKTHWRVALQQGFQPARDVLQGRGRNGGPRLDLQVAAAVVIINLSRFHPPEEGQVMFETVTEVTPNRGPIEIGDRLTVLAVVQASEERNGLSEVMDIRAEQAFHVVAI